MPTFSERLMDRAARQETAICVGIDPRRAWLPAEHAKLAQDGDAEGCAQAFSAWGRRLIELTAPYALTFKPQVAFFEALGPPGFRAYFEVCAAARDAGVPLIADVKRGDIGSTAQAYAEAFLYPRGDLPPIADAVTVNPYLGEDGVRPFAEAARAHDGGVFVLVRTSNPSSAQFQTRVTDGTTLAEAVASAVVGWNEPRDATGYGPIGAVVGATHPAELEDLRAKMPGVWILIPGVGAQGAGAADVVGGFDAQGRGAIINASRSIATPWALRREPAPEDWESEVVSMARQTRDEVQLALRKHLGS